MRPGIIVAVLLALLVALKSVFVVSEGQTALLLQFGRIVRTDYKPGLHFRIPLVQQVQRFDARVLTLDSAPERSMTSEKKDVDIDFFVKWRISDASKFFVSVAGDESKARNLVVPIVMDGLRSAVSTRTLRELVSGGRADVTQHLLADANAKTAGFGIEIIDLRIKRIDLPEDGSVIGSVYDRMKAERKKVASQLRAEGEEQARTIRADADRQAQVIKAEAYRDAEKVRGEGDAAASQVYAAAYGKDADFYSFYRSLEAYREAFSTSNGTLVLDSKSEFLHYLQDSK
ncbi:membrane protease subunit HflC [Dokdonella fugitiva]|uniref:Protein HflC n=1 Tax=Dokdonella fugitiva TaxID=328517 RepID=A0A839ETV7_9GAMM|nr:protease modulator HflC [Dokdonella fugitiva]MBA8885846.1 membrane protease subunit HflC [Dokdonella fugitiva]